VTTKTFLRSLGALAAGAMLTVGLGACGSDGPATPVATSSSGASSSAASGQPGPVSIKDFKFAPDTITVKAGEALAVTNNDTQAHTFTSDDSGVFDSGSIAVGTSAKPIVVATAGTYKLHCSFHPFMHGTLIVQ
jgi:plastocyanin